MSPLARRNLTLLIIILLALGTCIAFPRVLAFVERGAYELRYYWWLVLLVAVGGWLVFFGGRKDR
jgi:hypothetical protein